MNKIDEIALRVWYANNTCMPADGMNKLKEFAHALLAELSKDVEPSLYRWKTAHNFEYQFSEQRENAPEYATKYFTHPTPIIASEQKPVAWVDVIDRHEGPYNFNGLELLDSGKHLLFTTPPDTADIEQRVAEACAKMIQGWSCTNGPSIAEAIRSGKWREYL